MTRDKRQQFQDVSATLEPALSDISVTPEIHKISETLLAETLAHPEIPLTLGNTLVQIQHQHTAGPLKALFANGKKNVGPAGLLLSQKANNVDRLATDSRKPKAEVRKPSRQ